MRSALAFALLLAGCSHSVDKSYIPVDSQLRPWQPAEGGAPNQQAEKAGQKGKK